MKNKPHFTKLTITLTFYGVGETLKDAKQNALNEFVNEHYELFASQDFKQRFSIVNQQQTTIDQTFIDFIMGDNYKEHNAIKLLKVWNK
jgi:hypothetical protein